MFDSDIDSWIAEKGVFFSLRCKIYGFTFSVEIRTGNKRIDGSTEGKNSCAVVE